MSFTPMSKESMQKLKAEEDEKNRNKKIKEIVSNIYNSAIYTAKTTSNTSFHHEIPMNNTYKHDNSLNIFYINNKDEIVKILQELFTDCLVSFSILSRGNDGKMYDISKMDEKVIPFINREFDKSYIVIDWS
jgi:hypothetical protein